MKRLFTIIFAVTALCACNAQTSSTQTRTAKGLSVSDITTNTKIRDVKSDADFGNWGRLLFPANEGYYSGDTLGNLSLTWYSHINAAKTVKIVPFNVHGGSGLSGTDSNIKKLYKNVTMKKALVMTGRTAQNNRKEAEKQVDAWLKK